MILALMASAALAQDALPSGVVPVAPGSQITIDAQNYPIPAQYWLLPDDFYRKAVAKAKQLEICKPALEQVTEDALSWQDRTYSALHECAEQFGRDEALVQDLTGQVVKLETNLLISEDRQKRAQKVAIASWTVTGALVLGGTTAILVTR